VVFVLPSRRLVFSFNFKFLGFKVFVITETELKVIASEAIIGLSKILKTGNKTPAAIGTPDKIIHKSKEQILANVFHGDPERVLACRILFKFPFKIVISALWRAPSVPVSIAIPTLA
jgi:hypothetical protein